jgi:hypothetical protein
VGDSFLEELAREVVANAEIPDLGELFVQRHRAVEGSGWLLGSLEQGSQGAREQGGKGAGEQESGGELTSAPQHPCTEGPTTATQLSLF